MNRKHWTIIIPGAMMLCASPAYGIELREAVQAALATNPEIRQAVANTYATREERIQSRGRTSPRLSVEGRGGIRSLRNPTRRAIGIADETLYPVEGSLIYDQLIYDSGGVHAEVRQNAARTDAAAARVEERSEFIALNVSRAYIDYLLQQRLVAIAEDNATFHERLAGDLRQGVASGSISIADQQQAEERLQSARVRVTEAREDLDAAAIEFTRLAGVPIDQASMPPDLSQYLPATLAQTEELAQHNNPRVQEALADLSAARQQIRVAQADFGPRVNLEGRARAGHDIDGFSGRTTDVSGNVVLRWDLMNGGIREANVREQQARSDEAHARVFEQTRRAQEDARSAWSRLQNQTSLAAELEQQGRITDDLLLSYREQFNIGRRSLLDVLDSQNTRFNVQAQVETARMARLYAQYRVLAATNRLVEALGVQMPSAAYINDRAVYGVPVIPVEDIQENSMPMPVMGPPGPPAYPYPTDAVPTAAVPADAVPADAVPPAGQE